MGFFPFGPPQPGRVAATPPGGFTLVNGTPQILSWTTPNDGQLHRVLLYFQASVSSGLTGGQVRFQSTIRGQAGFVNVLSGGNSVGGWPSGAGAAGAPIMVDPNTTVTLTQVSAVTAGAGVVDAEIWGS